MSLKLIFKREKFSLKNRKFSLKLSQDRINSNLGKTKDFFNSDQKIFQGGGSYFNTWERCGDFGGVGIPPKNGFSHRFTWEKWLPPLPLNSVRML